MEDERRIPAEEAGGIDALSEGSVPKVAASVSFQRLCMADPVAGSMVTCHAAH
jgi:hypothetical protein